MRKLVLWGHHADEYQEMFALNKEEMATGLLEYGCGPTAVNAKLSEQGHLVVSCDSLFALAKNALQTKIDNVFADMITRVGQVQDKFDFSRYGSFAKLVAKRQAGIQYFLNDYEQGSAAKRYLAVNEQILPFADFSFGFALSSHYLFAGLNEQGVDFHLAAIKELARVAKEVRIFPLIDRFNQPSPFLGPVLLGLQQEHFGVEIREVGYRLQPNGNAMLRVWAQKCYL